MRVEHKDSDELSPVTDEYIVLRDDQHMALTFRTEVVERLGAGKRPKVVVSIAQHTYRTTIAPMGGQVPHPARRRNRGERPDSGVLRRAVVHLSEGVGALGRRGEEAGVLVEGQPLLAVEGRRRESLGNWQTAANRHC
jgi:hypothetical protein